MLLRVKEMLDSMMITMRGKSNIYLLLQPRTVCMDQNSKKQKQLNLLCILSETRPKDSNRHRLEHHQLPKSDYFKMSFLNSYTEGRSQNITIFSFFLALSNNIFKSTINSWVLCVLLDRRFKHPSHRDRSNTTATKSLIIVHPVNPGLSEIVSHSRHGKH